MVALAVVYCIWAESWEGTLFISGVLLAQFTLVREARPVKTAILDLESALFPASEKAVVIKPKKRAVFIALALFPLALFLTCAPSFNEQDTPGYSLLYTYFTPSFWQGNRYRFLKMTGAILLVFTVSSAPILQRFFKNSLSRYLGRISFALYLVHGPICHMVGHTIIPKFWAMTGGPTQAPPIPGIPESEDPSRPFEGGSVLGYEWGVVLGALIVVPFTIWMADIFCRLVDEQFVKLARKLENLLAGDQS